MVAEEAKFWVVLICKLTENFNDGRKYLKNWKI